MGGNNPKSKIVAVLCWPMHDRIDNKDWGNGVFDLGNGSKLYRAWTIHNETILERVLSSGAEPTNVNRLEQQGSASESTSAGDEGRSMPPARGSELPALVADEGEEKGPKLADVNLDAERSTPSPASLMDGEGVKARSDRAQATTGLTFDAAPSPSSLTGGCQEGMQILYWGLKLKDATDEWRWRIGDWLVRMEQELGEPAYQYFEPLKEAFGYDAIRQYKSVAERVTRDTRVPELAWSHHRAVASLDERAQSAALLTAREENLSSREVTAMVRPERPEREKHDCPVCGFPHWAVVEGDWKA